MIVVLGYIIVGMSRCSMFCRGDCRRCCNMWLRARCVLQLSCPARPCICDAMQLQEQCAALQFICAARWTQWDIVAAPSRRRSRTWTQQGIHGILLQVLEKGLRASCVLQHACPALPCICAVLQLQDQCVEMHCICAAMNTDMIYSKCYRHEI
jgi:hypothetical protein